MRVAALVLLSMATGCVSHLRKGDEAFAQGRHASAADEYRRAAVLEPDAVAFRMAVLHALEGSDFYDPARARSLLTELASRSPRGPFGVASEKALDTLRRQEELTIRLESLEAELPEVRKALEAKDAELQVQLTSAQEQAEKAAAESQRLTTELQELRAENERLQQELEALKSIDLRK